MWTFTKYGFFSIVLDARDHSKVAYRARAVKDLEALQAAFPAQLAGSEIILTPNRDYYARVIISAAQHQALALAMAVALDYSDFKTHLKTTHCQDDKLDILNKLWGTMNDYQHQTHPYMGAYTPHKAAAYTGYGRYGYGTTPKRTKKARKPSPDQRPDERPDLNQRRLSF